MGLACIPIIQSFIRKTPTDSQLFQSDSCHIACWNDLVVGQTDLDTLRTSLKNKFNHFEEMDTYKSTWKLGTKSFEAQSDDGMQVHIDTLGNSINKINLFGNQFSLSLNNVIAKLGSTKYIAIIYYTTSNDKMTIWSEVTFYYPDKGYVISAALPSKLLEYQVETCISDNDLVNNIIVVEPGSIDQVLMRLGNPSNPNDIYSEDRSRKYILNALKPLQKFGCFKMPFPPSSDLMMQTW